VKKSGSSRRRRKGKTPAKEAIRTEKHEKAPRSDKPHAETSQKPARKAAVIHPIPAPQGEKAGGEDRGPSRRNRNRRNKNRRTDGEHGSV
jgi:hypothetical protein